MTVPEWAIAGLTALGVCLAAVRIRLAVRAAWARGRKMRRWEIGASKTIGSREVQEDEYGIRETEDGLMAVMADGMESSLEERSQAGLWWKCFWRYLEIPRLFTIPSTRSAKGSRAPTGRC